MPNPLSDIAKSIVGEIRRVADTVEGMVKAAEHAEKRVSPENIAADLLEKLAKALRAKSTR